ncbi:MAG: MFS transporter [Erysipelotrichaceae bacterium]|nr:MFS transporter [Erysipelotrichaceae bacterium]MDY5252033.1 MFS transporter [Erysipelotrichaceae bacterium]
MKNLTKIEKHWILYDVANSAFIMMVSTIIPIFFKSICSSAGISDADSTAFWGYSLSISTLIVAFLGPTLGRLADEKDKKKKYFLFFLLMGCLGCASLGLAFSWLSFVVIFVIARIGYQSANVFYDSMLTDITSDERSHIVSSYGYALGYIGSCIPFVAAMAIVLLGDKIGLHGQTPVMIALIITALWWFGLSLPLLKNYHQIHYNHEVEKQSFMDVLKGLKQTLIKVKNNKAVFYFLIAYFFYIDGVYTVIEMATSYGYDVGISETQLLLALLLTQIIAFPFAIIFGKLSEKFKARKLINISIVGYIFIVCFALQLDKAWEFWFLAVCVAMFQGGIQALSRSYFARLVPKDNSNEYFGLFDIFGKGASFTGTLLVGVITQVTNSSTMGVAGLLILLIAGLFVMRKVPQTDADN